MKKKVLASLLAATMVASCLAGCGNSSGGSAGGDASGSSADGGSAEITDFGSGTITIWVADNVVDFTKSAAEDFIAANPDYSGYTISVEPVGEGDAAGNMITDVAGGADLYGFAQDQITRLVSAGALAPVVGDNASFVSEQNDAGAASAAVVGGTTYAYPMTSDNGYFLYYDSTVVSDPSSLEAIVADCESRQELLYGNQLRMVSAGILLCYRLYINIRYR